MVGVMLLWLKFHRDFHEQHFRISIGGNTNSFCIPYAESIAFVQRLTIYCYVAFQQEDINAIAGFFEGIVQLRSGFEVA